jgi:tripartite ATP-independent transporter DctM subunit
MIDRDRSLGREKASFEIIIAFCMKVIFAILIIAMIVVVFFQVANRYFLNNPLSWSEEVARILFIWITFLGTYWGLTTDSHIGVSSFIAKFQPKTREVTSTIVFFLILIYLCFFIQTGIEIVRESGATLTPALNIPFSYVYLVMPISGALMVVHLILKLSKMNKLMVVKAACITITVLSILYLTLRGNRISDAWLLIASIGFFICMITFHTPIAFAIGLFSIFFLIVQDRITLLIVPNRMIGGVDSFPLLAVPFFILAGELMNTGGITSRLITIAKTLVGHIRGGLGMVVVVAEYFFSGISGSTMADVSAIGSMLIPAMKKTGYKAETSVAIVSAAAAMGILVPPCVSMVVLGGMTGISIGALFMGGFIPAVVLALCIMGLIYYQAKDHNLPIEKRSTMKAAAEAMLGGIVPLLLPVIIFGGILCGVATATEVSVIAVLYGFIVGAFVYREIKPKHYLPIVMRTVTMTGVVMFLIATSQVLSWVFATNQVPKMIGQLIMTISNSAPIFLLLSNLTFVLLAGVLEGLPALIILIPIFLPLLNQFGVDPLHYGILVVAAVGIGTFLPPIGMGIFVACSFAEIDIGRATRYFLPYLLVLFIGLLIISYVPWFSLVLPKIFF